MKTYIAILRETGDGEKAGNERREKFESDDLENESPEDFATNVLCGDSKVVDANGEPLVVYHGTPNSFSEFDTFPAFFTPDPSAALAYAENQYARDDTKEDVGPNVMPVYLSMRNPLVLTEAEALERIGEDSGHVDWTAIDGFSYSMMGEGYDGLIIRDALDYAGGEIGASMKKRYDQYVVFRPGQIKSIFNDKIDGSPDQSADPETLEVLGG